MLKGLQNLCKKRVFDSPVFSHKGLSSILATSTQELKCYFEAAGTVIVHGPSLLNQHSWAPPALICSTKSNRTNLIAQQNLYCFSVQAVGAKTLCFGVKYYFFGRGNADRVDFMSPGPLEKALLGP